MRTEVHDGDDGDEAEQVLPMRLETAKTAARWNISASGQNSLFCICWTAWTSVSLGSLT
jgi:hypothetical protein